MPHIRASLYKQIEENNIDDVVFEDPFHVETRKTKRNLVAASFGTLLIAALELQISGFLGLQTATGTTLGVLITKGLACIVVLYFFAAFVLAAYVDYSAWKFRRERYLIGPYLELLKMLASHVHVTGEQISNATSGLNGIVIENDMRSQVTFQEQINNTLGQLESIQKSIASLHEEMLPLIDHWRAQVNKVQHLSWRLRARFLSLWILDMAVPITLACIAIWKTYESVPAVWERLLG